MTKSEDSTITITINGKERVVQSGLRVSDLLDELGLRERLVVVECNGSILNRSGFPETLLGPGDVLEIVHFVGGG